MQNFRAVLSQPHRKKNSHFYTGTDLTRCALYVINRMPFHDRQYQQQPLLMLIIRIITQIQVSEINQLQKSPHVIYSLQ